MGHAYLFALLCACVPLLIPERLLSQSQKRPDNFEVFQKLVDQISRQATGKSSALSEVPMLLHPIEEEVSIASLLRGRIVARALEEGRVVYSEDSLSYNQKYLQVRSRPQRYGIEYSTVKAGWLFRRSRIRRYVFLEADIEMIEKPSGQVWMHDSFKAEFADTVKSSEICGLEDPRVPFTAGQVQHRSAWSQIMEPLLLAAGTGAAVYALYALRSR